MLVQKSVLVPYTAQQMYALVDDVGRYPEFLPWCGGTRVEELPEGDVKATVIIRYRGLEQSFTTRNHRTPPSGIELTLIDGPFSQLSGRWQFTALSPEASKVELYLEYGFSNRLLATLVGPVFQTIAESFIGSFSRRADDLYGQP